MAKTHQTPEQLEKRLKAYGMYAAGVMDSGQRLSLRGIAQALGVTQTTVRYWRDHDKWEERIDAALQHKTIETTKDNVAVENLMRSGFYRAVRRLQQVVEDKNQKPTTTIRAVLAYGRLCKDFNVIRDSDLKKVPDNSMGVFQDDLPPTRGPHAPIPDPGRGGAPEAPGGIAIPLPDALPQPGSPSHGMDRGESGDRPVPLQPGVGFPGRSLERYADAPPEEEVPQWRDGRRVVRTKDPTNDTVLLDGIEEEIVQAKCPHCGRFWDGISCESCKFGVIGADPAPHDEDERD